MNLFALLSRGNRVFFRASEKTIHSARVCDYLDPFSASLSRPTVVVLDNATVHQGQVKKRRAAWEKRGLFVLFLPVYSPHLNIVEILWKKLKYEWLAAGDYKQKPLLL